jgi:hypothetical protein
MHAVGPVGKDLSSRLVPRCTGIEGIRSVRSGNNGISTCRGSVIVVDNLTWSIPMTPSPVGESAEMPAVAPPEIIELLISI